MTEGFRTAITGPDPEAHRFRQGEAPEPGLPAQWYVVQVKPRREARVVRHLALSAVPSFLPFIEVSRRRVSGKAKCLEPLFPGYTFVRLAPIHIAPAWWDAVRWAPGVIRIVGVGATPVPVADEMITAIEERTSECGFVRLPSPLTNGMKVRVGWGPFEGLEAVFDRPLSRAGRVRVLLQLLGQPTAVEIDEDSLDPA